MKPAIPLVLIACLLAGACAAVPPFDPPVPPGGTLYTRFTLQYEKDSYRTTNYRRGLLLPINSRVTLVAVDSRRIVVRPESTGRRLTIENVPRHTGQGVEQAFHEILGTRPVDLSGWSEDVREAILAGRVEPGMDKQAVLAALGPPPAVGTPSRVSPEWKYWDSRFSTFVVQFDADGRVVRRGR